MGVLLATPVAGAQVAPPDGPALSIDLREDGSASVHLTEVYDLDSEADREAFRRLQERPEVRTALRDQFFDRMARVTAAASSDTGRAMQVTDPAVTLSTARDGSAGIVIVGLTWDGLAVSDDGRLVVEEPFDSGFAPDRTFTVGLPTGYAVESVSPAPDRRTGDRLTWEAGTDFDGFSLVLVPGESAGASTSASGSSAGLTGTPGQPGFGPLAAGLAVLALVMFATRWR